MQAEPTTLQAEVSPPITPRVDTNTRTDSSIPTILTCCCTLTIRWTGILGVPRRLRKQEKKTNRSSSRLGTALAIGVMLPNGRSIRIRTSPIASAVPNRDEDRFVFFSCFRKRLGTARIPVHRIVSVQQQVRIVGIDESVRVFVSTRGVIGGETSACSVVGSACMMPSGRAGDDSKTDEMPC